MEAESVAKTALTWHPVGKRKGGKEVGKFKPRGSHGEGR